MDEAWQQRVRERAYAIWEREGCPEGRAEQFWRMAEEELRAEEQGQGEAPAAEAVRTAREAERATSSEEERERHEPVTEESPPAGQHGPAKAPAAEAVRTAKEAERTKDG